MIGCGQGPSAFETDATAACQAYYKSLLRLAPARDFPSLARFQAAAHVHAERFLRSLRKLDPANSQRAHYRHLLRQIALSNDLDAKVVAAAKRRDVEALRALDSKQARLDGLIKADFEQLSLETCAQPPRLGYPRSDA
jgi:hypothetical protein